MTMNISYEKGIKFDEGKLRFDLIPPDSLIELAKVYTIGAQKYNDNNWRKGIKWSRIFAAIMRHLWVWFLGEDIDPESHINHVIHAAWGCFTLFNYSMNRLEFDDRIKTNRKWI